MSDLPNPLIDQDVDLRGLTFMPLDIIRLIDSDLFAISTGDEFKAAVALWCKSWHQTPAASLPSDDRVLAFLSGAGPRWSKVKAVALRGWIKCSDGRLYHPVISEKAMAAWYDRLKYREKRDQDRHRLSSWRDRKRATETPLKHEDETDVKRVSDDVRNAHVTSKTVTVTETGIVKSERESARAKESLPDGVDPSRWIAYREQLENDGKLSPPRVMTAIGQLRQVILDGHDPNKVLEASVMRGLRDLTDCARRLATEASGSTSKNGQLKGQYGASKTASSINKLERIIHATEISEARNATLVPSIPIEGNAEIALSRA